MYKLRFTNKKSNNIVVWLFLNNIIQKHFFLCILIND